MRSARPTRTARSRRLRRDATLAERLLWNAVRSRQLDGLKFVRQEPIGPYYADFVCREVGLVIEIDGGQHASAVHDARRDAAMRAAGYRVLRFWNNEVLGNIEGVLMTIARAALAAPHPDPLPARGERETRQDGDSRSRSEGDTA